MIAYPFFAGMFQCTCRFHKKELPLKKQVSNKFQCIQDNGEFVSFECYQIRLFILWYELSLTWKNNSSRSVKIKWKNMFRFSPYWN